MTASERIPLDGLGDVAYLVRSENRVEVLRTIVATPTDPGRPTPGYTRRELETTTGISRPTLSRILNEFEERGWIERDIDGEYVATARGQCITIAFAPFMRSLQAIQHLGEAVSLLPRTELTIGLEHFRDATVREPVGPQPADFGEYLTRLLTGSSTYRLLSYAPGPPNMDVDLEQLDQCLIFADHLIDYLGEFTGTSPRDQIALGDEIYRYDGHVPCNLFIIDETVMIENAQVDGIADGTAIESRNEVVREWAIEVFDRYRDGAEKLTLEDIPE